MLQAAGDLTPLASDEIALQTPTDRGRPYVMALLDNTVKDLVL